MLALDAEDPRAIAVAAAIRGGEVDRLNQLLEEDPELARAEIVRHSEHGATGRSLLHVATDWPGHIANGAEIVRRLVAAGADVNARFAGPHHETPLHWAASSDDVEVLDVLLDAGADIEAPGAVIGGGTPLADAVAFGQWRAARRLVEHGARTTLWQAAALGLMSRVREAVAGAPAPAAAEITNAFWCACHGGQREAAEYLLERDADINWVGHDGLTPLDAALRSGARELAEWLRARGAASAREVR